MYPTPMRATATGLFSSTGRIGGIYAVVVLGLKRHWSGLPFVLFGAPSVAAALLALFFPGMFRTTLLSEWPCDETGSCITTIKRISTP